MFLVVQNSKNKFVDSALKGGPCTDYVGYNF